MAVRGSQRHWRAASSIALRLFLTVTILFLIGTIFLLLPFDQWRAHRVTFAGNTTGSFEIDGNLSVDHLVPPAEPIDWFSNPFPAALTTFTDGTGPTDDGFSQGSKENDQSTWICTAGSAPAKNDIVNQISINGAAPV